MLDDDTAEHARWNAAAYRAAGVPTVDISPRTAQALARLGILVAIFVSLGVVLALLVEDARPEFDGQRFLVQLLFLALATVVGAGGYAWARRAGFYPTRDQSLSTLLTRTDRRRAWRWIRGSEHPDPRWIPTLVALARQKQWALVGAAPIYAAVALIEVSVAISTDVAAIRAVSLLVVALFVGIGITSAVDFRHAERFIVTNRLEL
jgi:hypothetical protein